MKRRDFGLLAGTSLATAAATRPATAQAVAADATLLTTTLTPLGAERAGNADGSIPAWTGGMVGDPSGPVNVFPFQDEQPIVVVDASNLAQHQDLVAPGIQYMVTQLGFSIKVYPTHRTAAAPQYVYDNTAKNVTRSQLNPNGGRLGFSGGYGGVPFPIIDTSDPYVGGAQLIWNHLTAWGGFCSRSFTPGYAVSNGQPVLAEGDLTYFRNPYYDPDGSPETFGGYLGMSHLYFKAPSSTDGQEVISWQSIDFEKYPDIVWTLLNGQGRVRKAPNETYDTPNSYLDAISNYDENTGFYGNPQQYDWKCLGKQELYIPYHNNNIVKTTPEQLLLPKFPNPDYIRWEKHRVWVVEATLHPGYKNVLARRRFYLDEDTWAIMTGEAYDAQDKLQRAYIIYSRVIPALPGTISLAFTVVNPQTGDYGYTGLLDLPPYTMSESFEINPVELFDPQQMSANASF